MNQNNINNVSELSGNMYSYQDNSAIQNPPHESNAIRRSLGEGQNPNLNPMIDNTPTINQPPYLDQFKSINDHIYSGEVKNGNIPKYKNNIDIRSSEQMVPKLQNNFGRYGQFDETSQKHLPPREQKKFYLITYIIIAFFHIIMIPLIGSLYKFKDITDNDNIFDFFKDIHLMIFIGFGFIYTMLKDHQWSSVAIVLFLNVVSIEFSFICYYIWYHAFENSTWSDINITYDVLYSIEYNSATVLISLGAIIGKLTIFQYFYVSIFETFFASLNYFLCYKKIGALDNGGSIYIFTFGAIFGAMISVVLFCRESEHSKISNSPHLNSDYYSNLFAFIGTLFLWIYFPSFNTAKIQFLKKDGSDEVGEYIGIFRYRGIINTYLSMIGSAIATFIVSPLIYEGKLKIEHLLNSSYVGGIIIGGCCTICSRAWGAIIIGCLGGAISCLSLWKLKSILKTCRFEDTLGILHIFGIPGVLGGILTSIFMGNFSNKRDWTFEDDLKIIEKFFDDDTSPSKQGGLQVAGLFVSATIAGVSGIISGFIINVIFCEKNEIYFVDSELFTEDENIPLPEWKYPRQNDINLSSSGNKLDEQGREVNIEQEV